MAQSTRPITITFKVMKSHLKFSLRQHERKIATVFIAAFLLYAFVIIATDARQLLSLSAHFAWQLFPLMIALSFFSYFWRACRFHYLLRRMRIYLPFWRALAIFGAGISMTVTPGKMGEVVKAYLIKQETGHRYSQTVPILVFERLTDAVAMIILSLGGLYLFRAARLFYLICLLLVAVIFVLIVFYERLLPQRLDFLRRFLMSARQLLDGKTVGISVLFSLIAWSIQASALWLVIGQFLPSEMAAFSLTTVFYTLFIFAFSAVAGFLVLIPAGLGVAEGSLASFMMLFFHLTLTQAVFASLIFRFATLWVGVGVGAVFLVKLLKKSPKNYDKKASSLTTKSTSRDE